jgi:hypothetical protein
MTWASPAAS